MTRTMMLFVLASCVVVGAAAASIVTHDGFPAFGLFDTTTSVTATVRAPEANRDAKTDRLAVASLRLPDPTEDMTPDQPMTEPLRQAFASESPVTDSGRNLSAPVAIPPSKSPPKPKIAVKPPVQKTYTLLSDAQIAGIKGRLNLSPSQEAYWPGVEAALRAIARKMHDKKTANPAAGSPPIDPDSDEVSQLKSAAMPLLFQLREDQKREVRALARIIGLEAVAARI